jgi:ribosomal protein S18 acetylase RimI-like enzyme
MVNSIEVRKYAAATDRHVLEFLPGTTVVHIGGVAMSMRRPGEEFLETFVPDGFWLALRGAVVAGAILVGLHEEQGVPCVAVYGIKVDEPYRRRGIGLALMRKAEEFARSRGMCRLFLETRPDNAPALALFSKCGYAVVASTPERVRLEKVLQL